MDRRLATIRKIDSIHPIEEADNIVRAVVDGWNVVVKKGEFEEGDMCVYFSIDSLLPDWPQFEFLRSSSWKPDISRYRLRTVKLRGVISQGLALPLSSFPQLKANLNDDVTEELEVEKYEPPIPTSLGGDVKGHFPSFIPKTDEERIQNVPGILSRHPDTEFILTEKLDGCLDENTELKTEDGIKTVKEICDKKYKGKVESFNHINQEIEYKNIIGHSIKKNTNNWYEIETEDGEKIILTEDHYIWVDNIKAYRRVSDLNGDEIILKN